ncbi:MAG: hypothetical protein AVDCRST_MAG88-4159 [uncultured Thermomicrobiales bacterium]|uniref:Uncharacterized protein n=1 Tax=uncultured Thermomicrobiales bacterium TaxID=1645740 RepID=A0A6J4VW70_9BACT|nr:MAG: hypothetical protein AVDCRST_MAG88-4159 [uncultured Thermomicrobiales bacterium]
MPPVACCTFLTFVSTAIRPGAITAPAMEVVEAQPPTPPPSSAITATPPRIWRRMERRMLLRVAGFWSWAMGFTLSLAGRPSRLGPSFS